MFLTDEAPGKRQLAACAFLTHPRTRNTKQVAMNHEQDILPSIADMRTGDHYCNIYRSDEEHRRIVIDFVRQGVVRNEKMLYIVNVQTAAQLRETLATANIDVDALLSSAQLVIQTAKQAYLKEGEFDPDKMIELLSGETAKAVADGYTALRVTGDMTWALGGEPGSERVIEYEAKLNQYFPNSQCYAICQYDRRRFDAEMLLDILHTHPKVLLGQEGYDNSNMYFVPTELFLESDRHNALFERYAHNLTRHKKL